MGSKSYSKSSKLWSLLVNVEGLDMEKLGIFMNDPKADEINKTRYRRHRKIKYR